MKKKYILSMAILVLLAVALGCTATRTPTPPNTTVTPPVATPMVTPTPMVNSPGVTDEPGVASSPGVSGTSTSIPNFKEGTAVNQTDVPFIGEIMGGRYANSNVTGITHGLRGENHVYVVDYTDQNQKTGRLWIAPDGTVYTDDGTLPSSAQE